MAISKTDWLNGPVYDPRYSQAQYEQEMYRRRQEEEYRRMQQSAYYYTSPQEQQGKLANTAPKPDLKDPLAFLQNTDKKLLLTGEMQ